MGAKKTLMIGNAGGYWGDDPTALKRQLEGGVLDYITMDFLAEITMSIMQKQKDRDPNLGYARDFPRMIKEVIKTAVAKKTRIIANAGGVNPIGCAKVVAEVCKEEGFNPRIAVIHGDDILHNVQDLVAKGASFENMDDGSSFSSVQDQLRSANIYFGAAPVVQALKWNPDIIITGRVTDTGITLAPMIHEFGWSLEDWDHLARGIVAGHLMECGTQVCGGNFTDWHKVKSFNNIGFPIVEMEKDGTFVLTKHPNTGGLVSIDTAREQIFYEMGDPFAYISPDVVADFSSINLQDAGPDRVLVTGIQGQQPTEFYKVSMAYLDGFKCADSIMVSGPSAKEKAQAFSELFWERCKDLQLSEKNVEYLGWNACHQSLVRQDESNEIVLRLAARADDSQTLSRFAKLIPALILSGPPGVCVRGGLSKPTEVISYWPALIPKNLVKPKVALVENGELVEEFEDDTTAVGKFSPTPPDDVDVASKPTQNMGEVVTEVRQSQQVPLSRICLARSGDKGDICNVGVMARSPEAYEFLSEFMTAQRVKNWFQELCLGEVKRYRLDNLEGLNFLLDRALGGGGTKTLRTDAQGKTFAQALLAQTAKIPESVLNSVKD